MYPVECGVQIEQEQTESTNCTDTTKLPSQHNGCISYALELNAAAIL